MAKDPAFLFYSQDFTIGTQFFTDDQVGKYIRILSAIHQHGHLSEKHIIVMCGGRDEDILSKLCKDDSGNYYNKRLEEEVKKRNAYTESRRQARLKADEDQVKIYMIKDLDTGHIKIGSSVNPMRRFAEMCNQENPAITVGCRNYELIWYSNPTVRTEEKKLHKKFSEKKVKGEWFSLTHKELEEITKTYDGTYVKQTNKHTIKHTNSHTSPRTENENEIEDSIIVSDLNNKTISFENFWNLYDKKVGDIGKIKLKWIALTDDEKLKAIDHIPKYKNSQPDKKFRKDPATYLNNKSFNDEIIYSNGGSSTNGGNYQQRKLSRGEAGQMGAIEDLKELYSIDR